MTNITYLHDQTDQDLPPERVLEAAKEHCTEEVVVIGYGPQGGLYFAMSSGDAAAVLFALEEAKWTLTQGMFGGGE